MVRREVKRLRDLRNLSIARYQSHWVFINDKMDKKMKTVLKIDKNNGEIFEHWLTLLNDTEGFNGKIWKVCDNGFMVIFRKRVLNC